MELVHALSAIVASVVTGVLMALSPLFSLLGGSVVSTPPIHIDPLQDYATTTARVPAATTTQATSTLATSTPPKTTAPKKPAVSLPQPTGPVVTTPATPDIAADVLNTQTRGALVNILCTTNTNLVHPISASGVFIDSRGVILTNAHVGQFFLLADYPETGSVNCLVRTGSPATAMYRATLLYLPPVWINDNASQLIAEQAKGTGENDYAFLVVTSALSGSLPATFPTLSMTSTEPDLGDSTFLAAYPAGFLDGQNIVKNLYVASAYATVKELFTFGTARSIDLISIGGTIVSQGGSSGGAVVRTKDGQLEGIIATDTAADTTAQRDLRAITLAHINRSLKANGEGGIAELLLQNTATASANFAKNVAPAEKATLVKVIEHR